jgi:hypothetical protein
MSFIIKKISIKQLAKLALLPLFSPISSYAELPDFANNVLTLPSVTVGETTFNNVKLNLNLAAGTVSLQNFEQEHVFEMSTLLTPSAEVPETISVGAAGSLMEVDVTTGAISGFIVTTGISNLTAAHIHAGAAGVNGDPIITLELNTENNLFTIPSGTVLTEEQIAQLQEGNLYLNVHTSTNANGELREQLDINSGKIQDSLLNLLSGS